MSNQDSKLSLIPHDANSLYDDEAKVGKITFTKKEKLALTKLVAQPVWNLLSNVYVKQRAVQIAVAGINMTQNIEGLMFEKGRVTEVDHFIKEIEKVVKDFAREEKDKK